MKGVTLYNFPIKGGQPVYVDEDIAWVDIVERELGNKNLTSDKTARHKAFGPYVIQWDDSSLMRNIAVNESWHQFFEESSSPVFRFHGPMVMFHLGTFETDWQVFRRLVEEDFHMHVAEARTIQIEDDEVSNDDSINDNDEQ